MVYLSLSGQFEIILFVNITSLILSQYYKFKEKQMWTW